MKRNKSAEIESSSINHGIAELVVNFNLGRIRFYFKCDYVDVSPEADHPIFIAEAINNDVDCEVLDVHALDLNQNEVWQIADRYCKMYWSRIQEEVLNDF